MYRLITVLLTIVGLSACTPTTFTANSFASSQCFSGPHVIDLDVRIPAAYGPVAELAQLANGPRGLEYSCDLVGFGYPVEDTDYPIYAGEIYGGTSGLCVCAVTTNGGRVLSCATPSQVAAAVSAPLGTRASVITLRSWQPFPSS